MGFYKQSIFPYKEKKLLGSSKKYIGYIIILKIMQS